MGVSVSRTKKRVKLLLFVLLTSCLAGAVIAGGVATFGLRTLSHGKSQSQCASSHLVLQKNKPVWKPQQPRWTWNTSKPLQKRSSLSHVKVKNIKRKLHLEPLSRALKTSGGIFKFQIFASKYRAIFSETFEPLCSTCIWNLSVEPFSLDVEPWSETFMMWNLYAEIFGINLFAKHFCGTFMWNLGKPEPLCGALGNFSEWNLYVDPSKTWTFKSGTFMWNIGELDFFERVEPVYRNLGNLNVQEWKVDVEPWGTCTFMRTFKSWTFMWNLW